MSSLLALLLLAGPKAPPHGLEVRGLWVVRTALVSPRAVDRVVDQAREGGFNALFVQVRGRGDAFYDSRLVPRSELLRGQPRDFDPLARLITRARSRGLEVHGWVNVLLTANLPYRLPPEHILSRHPEWAMVPRSVAAQALRLHGTRLLRLIRDASRRVGDVEGFYLSPSATGVHDHLEAVVRELVQRYPLDGLHLDFIRYPGPDFDYSRVALEGFERYSGRRDLLGGPEADPEGWARYRRGILTRLVRRLAAAARRARPGIAVSAAVVPDEAEARNHKFQDWPEWVARGLVDVVCPMTYTPDERTFRRQIETARREAKGAVWAGVGAYRLPIADTIERIRIVRDAGLPGVLVFSHESLSRPDLLRLEREAFTRSAREPLRLPGSVAGR